jgi:tRNA(Ile)-lysidine synthase
VDGHVAGLDGLLPAFLTATRAAQVPDGARVVLAVSGGPDSMALLHLAVRAAHETGWPLVVAHLDHGLRPESAADARFVADAAAALGLAAEVRRTDVAALAAERGSGLEEAGRVARYAFLRALVADGAPGGVAMTGHTLDDQAETVLLHLARGTGLAGLAGIAERHGSIVRPLLGMRRVALRAALDEGEIAYRLDESNADRRFSRNRARADLVPLLESLHPGAAAAVGRAARIAAAENGALDAVAAAALAARRTADGWLAWADPPPAPIGARILRQAIGAPAPTAERIDAVLAVVASGRGGRSIELGAGRRAVVRRHRLRIVHPM